MLDLNLYLFRDFKLGKIVEYAKYTIAIECVHPLNTYYIIEA